MTGYASPVERRRWYREVYLQSDHWQKVRAKALEHAEHQCQVCNATRRLDVHHRTYDRLGRERLMDLTVLCRRCHELFHATTRSTVPAKRASVRLIRDPRVERLICVVHATRAEHFAAKRRAAFMRWARLECLVRDLKATPPFGRLRVMQGISEPRDFGVYDSDFGLDLGLANGRPGGVKVLWGGLEYRAPLRNGPAA